MRVSEVSADRVHRFQRLHIIINPSSGQSGPDLSTLNKVLQSLDLDWQMHITKERGDARRLALEAIGDHADAVAVYGGDGTLTEVAGGLTGSATPLVILPGGTANVLSVELGIPRDLAQAAQLLADPFSEIRTIDMGVLRGVTANGRTDSIIPFFRLGIGLEGRVHESADRDAKDQDGMFAYLKATLRSWSRPEKARYRIWVDGQIVEMDGINCLITTYGSLGFAGLTLSHAIDLNDGLLDIILFQDVNVSSMLAVAANAIATGEIAQPLPQWQGREVTVVTDPPQPVAADGELVEVEQVSVGILPKAVHVVVPTTAK
jgi:diacylglycerol kinase (ATP)